MKLCTSCSCSDRLGLYPSGHHQTSEWETIQTLGGVQDCRHVVVRRPGTNKHQTVAISLLRSSAPDIRYRIIPVFNIIKT